MSLKYLSLFPFYSVSSDVNSIKLAFLVAGLIKFILPASFVNKKEIYRFLLGFFYSSVGPADPKRQNEEENRDLKRVDEVLCKADVEIVLGRLEMACTAPGEMRLNGEDFSNTFVEKNPSLDEVKEAFDVFDKNRDGFVEPGELQQVLCDLGFTEGLQLANCRRMIDAFDENGDGRLCFDEFVKFMETR